MTAQTAVTCPQEIRTTNRRKYLASIWCSDEWRTESTAFKARHPAICVRCGRKGPIVPGHAPEDYFPGMEASYIQKVREDKVEALCPRCNRNEAKGRMPCPSCIERHRENPDHWIRYITQGQESCGFCQRDGKPRKRQRKQALHPCGHRSGLQRCFRNGKVYVCGWSAAKCRACDHFIERPVTGAKI